MGKRRFTEESWKNDPWFQGLVSAFSGLKQREDVEHFLRDIATLSELQALSERWEVCKQLNKGLSYRQVAANTGASTTTVTRVAKFLENGSGYRKLLAKEPRNEAVTEEKRDLTPTEQLVERRKQNVLQKYL